MSKYISYLAITLLLLSWGLPLIAQEKAAETRKAAPQKKSEAPRIYGVDQHALVTVLSKKIEREGLTPTYKRALLELTRKGHLPPNSDDWMPGLTRVQLAFTKSRMWLLSVRKDQMTGIAEAAYRMASAHQEDSIETGELLKVLILLKQKAKNDEARQAILALRLKQHFPEHSFEEELNILSKGLAPIQQIPSSKLRDFSLGFPNLKPLSLDDAAPHSRQEYMGRIALRHLNTISASHSIDTVIRLQLLHEDMTEEILIRSQRLRRQPYRVKFRRAILSFVNGIEYPAYYQAHPLPPIPNRRPDRISRKNAYLLQTLPRATFTSDQLRALLITSLESNDPYFKYQLLTTLVHTPYFEKHLQTWVSDAKGLEYVKRQSARAFLPVLADHLMTDVILQPIFMWGYREGYRTTYFKYLAMMGEFSEAQSPRLAFLIKYTQGDLRHDAIRCLGFIPFRDQKIYNQLFTAIGKTEGLEQQLLLSAVLLQGPRAKRAIDQLSERTGLYGHAKLNTQYMNIFFEIREHQEIYASGLRGTLLNSPEKSMNYSHKEYLDVLMRR